MIKWSCVVSHGEEKWLPLPPRTHTHTPSKFTVMSEDLDRHTGPLLECVMSAWLVLYILRPKQSLWIHEAAVEETVSSLIHFLLLVLLFSLFLWPLHPLPPSSMTSMYHSAVSVSKPKSYSTHPLFLLFISPLHLSLFHPFHPAVSLPLPELIGESHVVAEAWETDDGGWDVCFHRWSGCSERVLLGWQVKCAEKWVTMPELCVCYSDCVSCSCTLKNLVK